MKKVAQRWHTTHDERSLNVHRGFTLIELLVVISIIALLSSVVLASVVEAREKAYNAKVLQEVHQYVIALQMAKEDLGGHYPKPSNTGIDYCLGAPYPSGGCDFNGLNSDILSGTARNKIKSNYAGYPSALEKIDYGSGNNVWGYIYGCTDSSCKKVKLTWYLKGDVDSCGRYSDYDPADLGGAAYNGDSTTCVGTIGE